MVKPFILADYDIMKLKAKDIVVVDHEGEDEDCNASKAWLKVKGICLYDSDRRILSDGKLLYGTHLRAVQFFERAISKSQRIGGHCIGIKK